MKSSVYFFIFITCFPAFISCNRTEKSPITIIKFDDHIIDSLRKASDTVYTEFVGHKDFYTIDHYIDRIDSIESRILKDPDGYVTGHTIEKKGIMTFSAEYFSNGQIKGDVPIFPSGNGPATYFYPNGRVRSMGQWKNHRRAGAWHDYNEEGVLTGITYFDQEGKEIRSKKE